MSRDGRYSGSSTWEYRLSLSSEQKALARTEVTPPGVPELVGIDGRFQGARRIFPGMRQVTRIGIGVYDESDNRNAAAFLGQTDGVAENWFVDAGGPETKTVEEVHGFTLTVGAGQKLYGFAVKVANVGSDQYLLQFYDTFGITDEAYDWATPRKNVWKIRRLLATTPASDVPWSIVTRGRLLYLLVQGQEPVRMFVDTSTTGKFWMNVDTDTGPGARPAAPTVTLDFKSWPLLYNGGGNNVRPLREFPFNNFNSNTFTESSVINFDEEDVLDPGWYNFAYRYRDTKTGLVSSLSDLAVVDKEQFAERVPYQRSIRPKTGGGYEAYVNYQSAYVSQKPTLVVEATDDEKWDRLEIYRSIRVGAPGGEEASAILYLDKVITLEPDSSSDIDVTHADFLRDNALAIQPVYRNRDVFRENMPFAGAGIFYARTLFLSQVTGTETENNENIGEIFYSALAEESPELFPPGNRIVLAETSNEVLAWFRLGDSILGLTSDSQVEITISGPYAISREMHQGFGITAQWAGLTFGSSVFVVTRQGLREVRVSGELYGVPSADLLIVDEWKDDLGEVSAAYDAPIGCMFFLNPTRHEVLCLWTQHSITSELEYAPFRFVTHGVDPTDTILSQRAMFSTRRGVIVRPDDRFENTHTTAAHSDDAANGERSISMRGTVGDHFFDVVADGALAANALRCRPRGETSGGYMATFRDYRDCYIYVSSGAAEGSWLRISYCVRPGDDSTDYIFYLMENIPAGVEVDGVRIVVDPVLFKVVLPMVGYVPSDAMGVVEGSMFTLKSVESLGMAFEGVDGYGTDKAEATFYGSVAFGLESTQRGRSKPQTAQLRDGISDQAAVLTNFGVAGQSLFPVVEVVCPDVDFYAMSVQVAGRMMPTTIRTERT